MSDVPRVCVWERFRSKYLTDNLYSLLKLPLFWYKPKHPVFECCFNANELLLPVKRTELQNQIKSNHFYCHITTSPRALVSEILESVLQTVQKQFTYRRYILTDLSRKTMCRIHIHILSTYSVLFKTYLQLSIHVMHRMYTFYIMYTYTHNSMQKKSCSRFYIGRICNVMDVHCMVSSGSR